MRSLFFILFLQAVCVMAAGLLREYIYSPTKMIWPNAQIYCRQNYMDLATITTAEENDRAMNASGMTPFWIGLKRTKANSTTWKWSDGELATYFTWEVHDNNSQTDQMCVAVISGSWHGVNCSKSYHPLCYRNLILVKENKTWEEALQHCRTYYTDLYCPISKTQLYLAGLEAKETQTLRVWTGLRFLDGVWFWLNRWSVQSLEPLPSCPSHNYRCGALDPEMHVWKNRGCDEKLNFLCYW